MIINKYDFQILHSRSDLQLKLKRAMPIIWLLTVNIFINLIVPKHLANEKKLGEQQIQKQTQFVTFAKLNEKEMGIGYHFVGIFCFDGYTDEDCQTMIYKKLLIFIIYLI
ncbi:hypothetical protein [Spiroplasma endosymbiont of Glossina fuscipes fuscipes]|uniref:hypothetical protein n=1 Tax=Spiroplasma endosymbiont of Glossina fuscipes fuscipes TaxID=2004463 RepID=UPI003C7078F7